MSGLTDEKLAEIRAGLDGRRKMREQAQCDASLHLRSGQTWPCLLPWHRGYHVYDVAIDADRDLGELLAEVERMAAEIRTCHNALVDAYESWSPDLLATEALHEHVREWGSADD